ncbi:unnamed protein product, partial [Meganyctiphanes norvegica]
AILGNTCLLHRAPGRSSTQQDSLKASARADKMVLLHGVLYIEIIEGKDLPDVDTSWFSSDKDVSDPYVTVDTYVGEKSTHRIAKTSIIYNCLNPHWNEK